MPTTPRDLFIGGEIGCLVPNGGVGTISENTGANTFNSAGARQSISIAATNNSADAFFTDDTFATDSAVTGDTFHWRQDYSQNGTSGVASLPLVEFRDTSNFPWFAVRFNATGFQIQAAYNSGTGASPVWTLLGSPQSNSFNNFTLNVILTLGSPHAYQFLYNGNLVSSGTFTQASLTSLARARIYSYGNVTGYCSQLWATIGLHLVGSTVYTRAATGAGAANTFSAGAFTDINETTINDATNMVSNAVAQNYTFAMADLPALASGFVVGPVYVETRLKSDLVSPSNFATRLRSGGTNYDYSPAFAAPAGYTATKARWSLDPNTGIGWTAAGWNAAEVGGVTS